MQSGSNDNRRFGGVTFGHAGAFWLGVALVTAGVAAHLPMYVMGRDMGYRLAGMPMGLGMRLGMVAILVGLVVSLFGLLPQGATATAERASRIRVSALDDAPLTAAHYGLMVTMMLAVTIDIMKPTALAFVMPGMTTEYGLKGPLNPGGTIPVAYVSLSGIVGTVLGSFLWGWLGDRIGRRASILYAGIGFVGTSICGAMPTFSWNLVMCFVMGLAVGGMLPICYSLLAETIPARHRSWIMILIGADIAGAYIITSWLAVALVPTYSWRILWLIGLPTGLLFILLNRWIPESPRFLLANGRDGEADSVMQRFGAVVVARGGPDLDVESGVQSRWSQLLSGELLWLTVIVGVLALGSGLVLFGFNLWIPSNLRKLGFHDADAILRNAALIGFPLNLLVAWMYGFWSSKKTIIALSALTAAALLGFVVAGNAIVQNRALLYALLVVPIWGISSVVAVLSVYAAEVYPTRVRSRGSGFAAGASKAGGVAIIGLVAFGIAAPSISTVALIGAVPMALAVVLVAFFGVETRQRRLEEITAEELKVAY
ncbi:MAG TPA: MFS transporter [Gemmatimonadaceae bacterium]|jgi:putative MFS transporter|nr:MFS transporter [Gemmatimonadaceae bacterium]